MTIIKKRS